MNNKIVKYHNLLLFVHWLVALAMLVAGFLGYRHFAYLPWTEVEVYADYQQITKEDLRDLVLRKLHKGMLGDSLLAIKQELVGNPWVRRVRVMRSWPGILRLDVAERHLVAIWLDKTLIDDNNERIPMALAKQPLLPLPRLAGDEQHFKHILDSHKQLIPLLNEQGWQISSMERYQGNYWKIQLSIGTILFFMDKNLPQQFARFIKLYPQIVQQQGDTPQYVDFRYDNGNFAVK